MNKVYIDSAQLLDFVNFEKSGMNDTAGEKIMQRYCQQPHAGNHGNRHPRNNNIYWKKTWPKTNKCKMNKVYINSALLPDFVNFEKSRATDAQR